MTDSKDGKDGPPTGRGEELAEKLAGSNPVEPKPSAKPAPDEPVSPPSPPTTPPVASGPADAMNVKPAQAHAHANPAADATTKPPPKTATKPPKAEPAKAPSVEPPPPPPWYRTLRAEPPFYVRMALGFGMVALVVGLWWFLTRGSATEAIVSPVKLPSPGSTFGATDKLFERDLIDSIIDSLQRVFLGVGLAALVGVVLGILAGAHRGVSATLSPLVIFLRSVPMGALLPLTLMMFSDGEKQKYMFIFLAVVPFVFSDTVKAVSSVPDRYIETAQTLGASKRQIIQKVLVPLSLPDIITSLRFQFGLALGYIMLAEAGSTFVEHGLGKMIVLSEKRGWTEQVYLLLFIIALLAFLLDILLRTLQRGVFPWRKDL